MLFLWRVNFRLVALAAVAVLVVVSINTFNGLGKRILYADFPRTVSVYPGSEVKVMGVAIGKVDEATPVGTVVRTKLEYDDKWKLADDVKAVIISPSVVGDRFVQITAKDADSKVLALGGTKVLPDGARLGTDRTAVPLELDEIFGSISQLTVALGPNGANAAAPGTQGALSRLIDTTARNFGGNGVLFNQTLHNLGDLTKTLADSKDQFFSTQSSVEKFVNALSANDDVVRKFNDSLAGGANLLASERQDLATALDNLSTALGSVRSYVHDNRTLLTSDIDALARVTDTLAKRRAEITEALKAAPLALSNLNLAGDNASGNGTLDTRANIGQTVNTLTSSPLTVLCGFLVSTGTQCPLMPRTAYDQLKQAQDSLPVLDLTLAGLVSP